MRRADPAPGVHSASRSPHHRSKTAPRTPIPWTEAIGDRVGIGIAHAGLVLIAIPHFQGRVSPVFDVASRLTVVRVKGRLELERREVTLFEAQPDRITRSLVELGVDVLICGAISQMLKRMLHRAGVRVVAQVCGEVEAVLQAFLSRTLDAPEFGLPGCFRPPSDRGSRQAGGRRAVVQTGRRPRPRRTAVPTGV